MNKLQRRLARPSTFFILAAVLALILLTPSDEYFKTYPHTLSGLVGLWVAVTLLISGLWLDNSLSINPKHQLSKVTCLFVGFAVIETVLHLCN